MFALMSDLGFERENDPDNRCGFSNFADRSKPSELVDFLGEQNIPLDVFRITRTHLGGPQFAKSIERHAFRQR